MELRPDMIQRQSARFRSTVAAHLLTIVYCYIGAILSVNIRIYLDTVRFVSCSFTIPVLHLTPATQIRQGVIEAVAPNYDQSFFYFSDIQPS